MDEPGEPTPRVTSTGTDLRIVALLIICAGSLAIFLVAIRKKPLAWAYGEAEGFEVAQFEEREMRVIYKCASGEEAERLVLEPLRAANLDEDPAKYAVFGELRVQIKNCEEKTVWLFEPFGHFELENEYFTADLTALEAEIKKRLEAEAN